MKVGTDGVLLGAWVSVRPSDRRILDIGTGTGLIALMMAQRVPGARITGVDVEDISQARENADASPWGGRVTFVQCPVQEFAPQGKFDLVVSNPPFFVDSLTCPDAGRTTARHAVRLPFGRGRPFHRHLPGRVASGAPYRRAHDAPPRSQTGAARIRPYAFRRRFSARRRFASLRFFRRGFRPSFR